MEELNSLLPTPQNAYTKMMQFSVPGLYNQLNILLKKKKSFTDV